MAVVLTVSLVPTIAVTFFAYNSAEKIITVHIQKELDALATIQEHRIEGIIGQMKERLDLVRSRTPMLMALERFHETGDRRELNTALAALSGAKSAIKAIREITILGNDGKVVVSTNVASSGKDRHAEDYFVKGKLDYSLDVFALDSHEEIIQYLSCPVDYHGKNLGVLVIESTFGMVADLTREMTGLGSTGETLLAKRNVSGDALYIVPLRFDAGAALKRVVSKHETNTPIVQAMQKKEQFFADSVDYRGMPVLAATRHITETDWGLVVKMDRQEAYSPLYQLRIVFAAVFLFTALLTSMASVIIARWLVRPILVLTDATKKIHEGDLTARIHSDSGDEFGFLTRGFDDMVQRLKQSDESLRAMNLELEQRVEERTTALRESEAKYRIVADNTYDWEFWLSPEGRFLYNSPSCERITGYSPQEFGSDPGLLVRIIHPDDNPLFERHRHTAVQERKPEEILFRIIHKNGGARWMAHLCQPVFDQEGAFIGSRGSNRDFTERKLAERQLQHSEDRLKTLFDLSQYGATDKEELLDFALHEIIRLSESKIGYIYYYDEATQEFTLNSWSRDVMKECSIVQKKTCYELAKTGIWGEAVRQRKPIILNDFVTEHPLKKGCPEGHVQLKKYLTVPVFRNDRIVAVAAVANREEDYADEDARELTIVMDAVWSIVERKEADRKLNQYASALERSNRELEQFAYVASHDLQEPLRKVAGFSELLANRYRGKLDAKADGYIEYITDGAKRMSSLINDLLSYSRVMTRGKAFTPVDAGAVLRQVIGDLELMINEQKAVVTSDSLPTVVVDRGQFSQLMQNLVGNGIKYHGEEAPKVQVSAMRVESGWQFAVRDNGIGIAPEHFERIFMIFQRLHTRTEYAGSGIGLAICKKIVERHGGRIWVESEPGKGSTFFFTVPDKASRLEEV